MTSGDPTLEENNSYEIKLTSKDEQTLSGYKHICYFDKKKKINKKKPTNPKYLLYPVVLNSDICLFQTSQIFE